jgi:hypothetical protein
MTKRMYVRDLTRLLETVFESMLNDAELRSLTFRVVRVSDAADGRMLSSDASIVTHEAWVRWQVLGEDGGTGSLPLDDGPDTLVQFVQGDLQDFIAESRFGWGELRRPR